MIYIMALFMLVASSLFADAQLYIIDTRVAPSTSTAWNTVKGYGSKTSGQPRDRFHAQPLPDGVHVLIQAEFTPAQRTYLNGKSWARFIGKQSGINVDQSVYDALREKQYEAPCSSCP